MSLRIALFAAATVAVSTPAAAQSSTPFAFEDVDFTSDCSPNAAFHRLLGILLGSSVDEDAEPEFDELLFNAVSGDTDHVLRLSEPAAWYGLRLVEVRTHFGIERGPYNHSLVFADGPDRVREVWNARGWRLPVAGEIRAIDDEAIDTAVGIEADGELAAVTCFVD